MRGPARRELKSCIDRLIYVDDLTNSCEIAATTYVRNFLNLLFLCHNFNLCLRFSQSLINRHIQRTLQDA
jgi:hypothetical protein